MAGPGFSPIGSMSSNSVDFSPLMERLRMQLAANQFGQQQQQQQQFHAGEMDLANLRLTNQESQFARDLGERQAGRSQQGELARAGLAFQDRELGQRGEIAKAGQDLTRRGQDIGVSEGAAERVFRREEGAEDRKFRKGEGDANRGIQREGMAQSADQFSKELELKFKDLDFRKGVAFKQLANEDKRMEFEARAADLDAQYKEGLITQQGYETEKLRIGVEAAGAALAEAKADVGLSPAQWDIVIGLIDKGKPLPGEIMARIQSSPKAASALEYFYRAIDAVSGRDSTAASIDLTKATAEGRRLDNVRKARDLEGAPDDSASRAIEGQLQELDRARTAGKLGDVGEARYAALKESQRLTGLPDEVSTTRKQQLDAFAQLAQGMESGDMSDVSWDGADSALALLAVPTFGTTLLPLLIKKGVEGIGRLSDDEKDTAIRQMAEELNLIQ